MVDIALAFESHILCALSVLAGGRAGSRVAVPHAEESLRQGLGRVTEFLRVTARAKLSTLLAQATSDGAVETAVTLHTYCAMTSANVSPEVFNQADAAVLLAGSAYVTAFADYKDEDEAQMEMRRARRFIRGSGFVEAKATSLRVSVNTRIDQLVVVYAVRCEVLCTVAGRGELTLATLGVALLCLPSRVGGVGAPQHHRANIMTILNSSPQARDALLSQVVEATTGFPGSTGWSMEGTPGGVAMGRFTCGPGQPIVEVGAGDVRVDRGSIIRLPGAVSDLAPLLGHPATAVRNEARERRQWVRTVHACAACPNRLTSAVVVTAMPVLATGQITTWDGATKYDLFVWAGSEALQPRVVVPTPCHAECAFLAPSALPRTRGATDVCASCSRRALDMPPPSAARPSSANAGSEPSPATDTGLRMSMVAEGDQSAVAAALLVASRVGLAASLSLQAQAEPLAGSSAVSRLYQVHPGATAMFAQFTRDEVDVRMGDDGFGSSRQRDRDAPPQLKPLFAFPGSSRGRGGGRDEEKHSDDSGSDGPDGTGGADVFFAQVASRLAPQSPQRRDADSDGAEGRRRDGAACPCCLCRLGLRARRGNPDTAQVKCAVPTTWGIAGPSAGSQGVPAVGLPLRDTISTSPIDPASARRNGTTATLQAPLEVTGSDCLVLLEAVQAYVCDGV